MCIAQWHVSEKFPVYSDRIVQDSHLIPYYPHYYRAALQSLFIRLNIISVPTIVCQLKHNKRQDFQDKSPAFERYYLFILELCGSLLEECTHSFLLILCSKALAEPLALGLDSSVNIELIAFVDCFLAVGYCYRSVLRE